MAVFQAFADFAHGFWIWIWLAKFPSGFGNLPSF